MSVYGAASGRTNKKYYCDFDGLKRKELERRKKLRLEQVRTQSNELSAQIRDRVAREKHQQLRNVEEIKRRELLSWKEKHVNNTMADFYYCLSNVGDAHVAAERENELTEQMNAQQRENRKIAVQRGRKALQKERLTNVKKKEAKRKPKTNFMHKIVPTTSPKTPNAVKEDDELLWVDESDDESIGENVDLVRDTISPDKSLSEPVVSRVDQAKGSVRFSQVSDLVEERRRARNLCDQMLESGLSEPPETLSKSPRAKSLSPQRKPLNAPKSTQAQPLFAPKSTKPVPKSPVPKPSVRVGFVPNQFSRDGKAATKTSTSPGQSIRKAATPHKVVKPKNAAVAPSKFVSPQRREFVPRFTTNPATKAGILKNVAAPKSTEEAIAKSPDKVQFYDHCSRYSKECDAQPGLVTRETHPPAINANEAARVQNELDEIRFQQLDELRRKSEQRSQASLQKNQVRRDYENLTKQLDELCKEENRLRTFAMPADQFSEDRLSQLALNRQQNMNRAFEDVYHRPVVITCPPIGSNQNSSSSDFNVATSLSSDNPQRPIDPFDSSDSCTSILLGYVDNRSRKLLKDIKQCKDEADGDKRKKLVTLLTRLDHLRKLLLEEIVRNSSLNLEPFYRSVLEVETEKKEILHDPDANKENGERKRRGEQLNKGEPTAESQDVQLEKKLREMLRQGLDKVRGDDNTFDSVTSETTSSNADPSEPVKILIELKNGGKIRKSRHPENVRVTQIVGKDHQHKTSVVSSASTAYRDPPSTFHTDFTKVLSQQASAKPTKESAKPASMTRPTTTGKQTPLGHYITRLLGMSQQSIDQLGVSTGSSITTPSDSVIDVPDNMSTAVIDRNHLNRVQEKINDSLRLAKEVDYSFEKAKQREEVAKKMRETAEQQAKLANERQTETRRPQTIQRSGAITKTPEKPKTKQLTRKVSQARSSEAEVVPNIPENSKRIIADLTKQIERVRQDKLKLIEKTLSSTHSSHSSSGKEFDVTEYKDFVEPPKSKSPGDENVCSSQASDVQSLPGQFIDDESKNLMKTKQIGISFSRDSGIGSSRPASRPVTSTDFRVSPDIKLATPQTGKNVGTDLPMETNDESSAATKNANSKATGSAVVQKSAKPPISLKRFSPQLDTEQLQPHDLSTINEVETSAASRFNLSTRNETSDPSIPYAKFPTFVEYAKMQEIASIDTSSGDSQRYSETMLKKMLDVTTLSETDLNYREFDKSRPRDKTTETGSEYIDVEKEMKQRRLMEAEEVFSTSTSDSKLVSSTTSSDLLAKDFNRIGLNWASAMLKKTSDAQNLESSSSSIAAPKQRPVSGGSSSDDDRINGNPLNIRDFLARELLKRSQLSASSSMSDNSTLTDQFLKSLLSISTGSSVQQQGTLRTSTPNRNQSSESEKFVAAHDIGHTARDEHLFSGESVLSSVRGMSNSDETSGARETSE